MMRMPIIGTSGFRGIVGETLTPEFVARISMAFGTYINQGRVVVAQDTRQTGEMLKYSVISGLLAVGCEVTDLGVVPTPTCQFTVREKNLSGGIIVSGSHNPINWNALKFIDSDGIHFNIKKIHELLNIFYQGEFLTVNWDKIKNAKQDTTAPYFHMEKIFSLIDKNRIKSKRYKVVIDSCNGAGAVITPTFLRELGCEVIEINCIPNGLFPRNPEPTINSLQELSRKVVESQADIGFAQDPDADRLAIVLETGEIVSEEYTLAIIVNHVLKKTKGDVVMNLSTSRMTDDIVKKYNCRVVKTPVGEVNVAEKIKEINAVIGGEGNGGIIYPSLHYGRDSLMAMGLILEHLAVEDKRISDAIKEIPKYEIIKKKIECSRSDTVKIIERLKEEYKEKNPNLEDGIRVDFEDCWFHVRRSTTEPVIRVIAESMSKKKTIELLNSLIVKIEEIVGKHLPCSE